MTLCGRVTRNAGRPRRETAWPSIKREVQAAGRSGRRGRGNGGSVIPEVVQEGDVARYSPQPTPSPTAVPLARDSSGQERCGPARSRWNGREVPVG